MKSFVVKTLAVIATLAAVTLGFSAPAHATSSPTSMTLSGFNAMVSTLTPAQKSTIRTFTTAHTGITTVNCVGYTGYNYLKVQARQIRALAQDRARKTCAYVASVTGATVGTLSVRLMQSQSASIRKVVVSFTYSNPGRYEYSMSTLDPGSVMHGGPVTGYFHEGDLVASTFSDTAWSLDGSVGPEYGQMGTVGGGSAAYFGHWNTQPDDTGTSYFLGDHLGHIPDGTTVTLYAIPATG